MQQKVNATMIVRPNDVSNLNLIKKCILKASDELYKKFNVFVLLLRMCYIHDTPATKAFERKQTNYSAMDF